MAFATGALGLMLLSAAQAARTLRALDPAQVANHWTSVTGNLDFQPSGVTREYWIKCLEVEWNYAPAHMDESGAATDVNALTRQPFTEDELVFVGTKPGEAIGSTYTKAIFREFTAGWAEPIPRKPEEEHLAILGPVIRAAVGDTITVHYKNECSINTTMHAHGVAYSKGSEGGLAYHDDAMAASGTTASAQMDPMAAMLHGGVAPNGTLDYVWLVPEQAGPTIESGLSSTMWLYHSHHDEIADTNAGLVGPLVITAAGMAREDGSPMDVEREVFGLWTVMDENQSPYLDQNMLAHDINPETIEADEAFDMEVFEESNLMHAINGYVYGHGSTVSLCKGQRVRWYNVGLGTEVDMHTPHWHGHVVVTHGQRVDSVSLLPSTVVVSDMVPYSLGTWLYHCHVNDHISAGMKTVYEVRDCAADAAAAATQPQPEAVAQPEPVAEAQPQAAAQPLPEGEGAVAVEGEGTAAVEGEGLAAPSG